MRVRALLLPLLLIGIAADSPPYAALGTIQHGRWQLTSPDGDFQSKSICLGDPQMLLQLKHVGAACSRFVITNDPETTTVQYNCREAGYGRTTVRVETPRLIQVQTQGIVSRQPFDISIEARRSGECGAGVTASR